MLCVQLSRDGGIFSACCACNSVGMVVSLVHAVHVVCATQ